MTSSVPLLPRVSRSDLILRHTSTGWFVEDASGRRICEALGNAAEARLVGRTFVSPSGRVWVVDAGSWSVLDAD